MMDYSIMWFGFNGQTYAKSFGAGRFYNAGEEISYYGAKRNIAIISDNSYATRRVVDIPPVEQEKPIDHTDRMRQHLISQFQWEVYA